MKRILVICGLGVLLGVLVFVLANTNIQLISVAPTATPAYAGNPCEGVTPASTQEAKQACLNYVYELLGMKQPTDNGVGASNGVTDTTGANVFGADDLFGTGTCTVGGATYQLTADAHTVKVDPATLKKMIASGGTCNVTTYKEGWYWSVAFGTITWNGTTVERGMALPAKPGKWVFTYDAPAAGTTNDSIGLVFHDFIPSANLKEGETLFAKGACQIGDTNYEMSANAHAIYQEFPLLPALVTQGGTCKFTTYKSGWYWSVQGDITLNGKKMANGSRLIAPPGEWVIAYPAPVGGKNENYGFIVQDNVPFGQ